MKKYIEKLPLILWTCFLCLFLVQGTAQADDSYQTLPTVSEVYINPLYNDVITEGDLTEGDPYVAAPLSEVEYVSEEEAAPLLREQVKERIETVKVCFITTRSDFSQLKDDVWNDGLSHTKNPIEGDYLKWQYAGYSWTTEGSYKLGGIYYLTYTYTVTYYTTATQEAEMDSAVASLVGELGLRDSSKSDFEKIKAIYGYICDTVKYDYTNLNDNTYKLKYTAYAALFNKTAVCQGYAILFYRLALESGIDARLIAGEGGGSAHGWNIVELNGKYYNLDATWDAGKKLANYGYFLKCTANFGSHIRDEEYDTASFHALYEMGSEDYYICEIYGHKAVTDKEAAATCTNTGLTEGSHCSACGEVIVAQEEVSAKGHTPGTAQIENKTAATCKSYGSYDKVIYCTVCKDEISREKVTGTEYAPHTEVTDAAVEPTCTSTGLTEGSHCSVCEDVFVAQKEVPAKDHTPGTPQIENKTAATCKSYESYDSVVYCMVCKNEISRETVTGTEYAAHTYGASVRISEATVSAPAKEQKTCKTCGHAKVTTVGEALKARISVNASSLILKKGQKTTALNVSFENGDYVKSWKSSNTKVVRVTGKKNGTCTIKAQRKIGSAKITVTLASGEKKTIKVRVQSKKVTTTSIKLAKKKLTLKKGKKLTLEPIIKPITSQSSVKYTSSNKKVATVSTKGVVKGKKVGTAKITIRSGTKKVVCNVKVTK